MDQEMDSAARVVSENTWMPKIRVLSPLKRTVGLRIYFEDLFGGSGRFHAKGSDSLVHDSVKKLVVVGFGASLDHRAHPPACSCRVRQTESALLR